ncbi:MAG: flagellar hook protein FlgE, partial [Planctomycetota bacterium]
MGQGNIVSTGQDLDVAIDGNGYFVLNNGKQDIYTRVGSFGIDENNTLVDPNTGFKVQRIGSFGEAEGFQSLGDSSIHIPWDASMPANSTGELVMNGNLRSSATSNSGDNAATSVTYISDLDQWSTALGVGDTGTIQFSGIKEDGTVFTNQPITWTGAAAGTGDTMQSILDQITALYDDSTAILNADGRIVISANSPGYNLAQVTGMSYVAAAGDALTVPTYFDYTKIGGNDDKDFKITVFDNM